MSKLTIEERLLHALNGIKQVLNNLGVDDINSYIDQYMSELTKQQANYTYHLY